MAEEKDIFNIFEKVYPGKRMHGDKAFVRHPYIAEHTRSRKFLYPDIKPVDPDSLFASRRYPTEHAMEEAFKRKRRRAETRTRKRDEKRVVMVDNLNHAEDSTATSAASSGTNNEANGGSFLNNELGLLSLEASGQSSSTPTGASSFGKNDETGGGYVLNIDSELSNEEAAAHSSSTPTGAATFGVKAGDSVAQMS